MELGDLVDRLDDDLLVDTYRDDDLSLNGLQVGDRRATVERIVGAVDAAMGTIERAIDRDADLLIVHHGLFWGQLEAMTDHRYDRIRALVEGDLALYTCHLPLDGHPTLGNAAVIASRLGMDDPEPFPDAQTPIGVIGSLETETPDLIAGVADAVDIEADSLRTLGPEPASIERLAIVTGSGTDYIESAATAGADVLLTGEGKHSAFHKAEDIGLSVILAGHYATETVGIQALLGRLDDWGFDTAFVDLPTGL